MSYYVLSDGTMAQIDPEDEMLISQYSWYPYRNRGYTYAASGKGDSFVLMHRLILGLDSQSKLIGHHKNGDGLDNRRCNLEAVTIRENIQRRNALPSNNSSGYMGVVWDRGKWKARIKHGKTIHLGRFDSKRYAALMRDLWALEVFGPQAFTNAVVVSYSKFAKEAVTI